VVAELHGGKKDSANRSARASSRRSGTGHALACVSAVDSEKALLLRLGENVERQVKATHSADVALDAEGHGAWRLA
jgi:hypothetical protein